MPEASIAVLVQTNDQAAAMLDALRRLGVEASGEGTGAVADDPAVAVVIAALILADHPGDTIAAFHVTGSPLGGVIGLRSRGPAESLAAWRNSGRTLRSAAPRLCSWSGPRALREAAGHRAAGCGWRRRSISPSGSNGKEAVDPAISPPTCRAPWSRARARRACA